MARVIVLAALTFLYLAEGAELAAGPFETGVAERYGTGDWTAGKASGPPAQTRQGPDRAAGVAEERPRASGPTARPDGSDDGDIDAEARLDYSSSRGGAE